VRRLPLSVRPAFRSDPLFAAPLRLPTPSGTAFRFLCLYYIIKFLFVKTFFEKN